MKKDELQKVINHFRRRGLSNGAALGHHSGVNDEIADLLGKHMPKKPDSIYREEVPYSEEAAIFGTCPCCNNEVQIGMNYCSACGQTLDWETMKNE